MALGATTNPSFRPGIWRWLTVGTAAYGGWLLANLILAGLMPPLVFARWALGAKGRTFCHLVSIAFSKLFFLRFFHRIGMYRVESLPDIESMSPLRPCLFVANHRSWLDALLLTAVLPNVRIPVNAKYLRIPIAGTLMKWAGAIPLRKHSRESILEGAEEVRSALRSGSSVAVFPEGTRYPLGKVGLFSDFFFRIAIDENVPVVPVIIHLGVPFLGPSSENFLTARKTDLKILVLDPITDMRGARAVDLARQARKRISKQIAKLDENAVAKPAKECR